MKYQKIVDDLNNEFDLVAREQHERGKKLSAFLRQFNTEDQKLQKRLNKGNEDNKRSKLKKQLNLVKEGYELLESNLRLRHA